MMDAARQALIENDYDPAAWGIAVAENADRAGESKKS